MGLCFLCQLKLRDGSGCYVCLITGLFSFWLLLFFEKVLASVVVVGQNEALVVFGGPCLDLSPNL
jgi:hypothetical protein